MGFVRDLYVPRDRERFISHLLGALPGLVPCELVTFNEADPVTRTSRSWLNPMPALKWMTDQIWNRLMHQHPFVRYQQGGGDARPIRLSELTSLRDLARTDLFNELLRPLAAEYEVMMGLPYGPDPVSGVAVCRQRRDFSDRERLLLTLLHPHVIQADRNAAWVGRRLEEIRMLERGVEQLDRGLVALSSDAAVRLATTRARQWLSAYFPDRPNGSGRLPDALHRWVVQQMGHLQRSDLAPPPDHTIVVERAGARLIVRLVADREGPLLFLHEEPADARSRSLRALGLSRREAEVLSWVTEGKTNPEIAVILGLSARTVQTHLDRIFRKLDVETRTAAVAAALKAGEGG